MYQPPGPTIAQLRAHALATRGFQLQGLQGTAEELDAFVTQHGGSPSSSAIADFLRLYPEGQRNELSRKLIEKGISQTTIANALVWLDAQSRFKITTVWGIASTLSMAVSAFHGYRRNQSVGWAIWWGMMGTAFPVITPVVALAQGFGKRKG